jgi:hypothetical protein
VFKYHFEKSQERYKRVSIEEAFQSLHNGKLIRIRSRKKGRFYEYFQMVNLKYRNSSKTRAGIQRWYGYNEEAKMGIQEFDFSTSFFTAEHILGAQWYVKIS